MSPAALGQAIAAALGIAVSPVSIATVILLLLSPRAKTAGPGFLSGWAFGIAAAVTAFALLAAVVPLRAPGAARSAMGVIELAVGVLLLVAAAVQWHRRRRTALDPERTPAWLGGIDRVTFPVAFALGCVMAVNPPNLLLSLAGGIAIGTSALAGAAIIAAVALFTAVATSTVLLPVLTRFTAGDALQQPLDAFRAWLTRHSTVILVLVFAVVGLLLVVRGIMSLATR